MAAMKPPSPRSLSVCCAAGGKAPIVGRRDRSQPQTRPADQRAAAAAQGQRNTADLEADEACEQARRDTGCEKSDVGAVAGAQDLSDFRGGALDVAGAADERHDVAHIDAGIRAQGDLAAHPGQRAEIDAARVVADAFGDLLDRPAMEIAAVDEDVDHVARNSLQNLVGIDLLADDRLCSDEGRRSPGNDDVVARFENGVEARLNVGSIPHYSLDDSAAADFLFDILDRASRGGRDPIGARLEFPIMEIFVLWRIAAGKLRLQFRRLLLQIDPISFGATNGTYRSVRM